MKEIFKKNFCAVCPGPLHAPTSGELDSQFPIQPSFNDSPDSTSMRYQIAIASGALGFLVGTEDRVPSAYRT